MPRKTLLAALIAIMAGCNSESPDARLTRVTEQALTEQAAQNQRMAELEQDVQSRSAQIDQQRDDLEQQRQELARARIREPLVANSLLGATSLLVAAFPLVAVVLLLLQLLRQPPAADVSELLVDELATGRLRMAAPPALLEPTPPAALPAPEHPSS